VVSQYVINDIKKEFTHGEDIRESLDELDEFDFDAYKPILGCQFWLMILHKIKRIHVDKIFEA
jgi:hypothetical protein